MNKRTDFLWQRFSVARLNFLSLVFLIFGCFSHSVSAFDRREIVVSIQGNSEVPVDLGLLCFEERFECNLKLQNESEVGYDIDAIQSGCGCVQSTLAKSVASKGESLDLNLAVRPKDVGNFSQVLFLKSKNENGTLKVLLRGKVRRKIEISPIDRSACRNSGRFTTDVVMLFGADLVGATVVSDPLSEFDLELKKGEHGFVLTGLARNRIELWPVSGFSETVVFRLPDGNLLSSYLTVIQSFKEVIVPTRLKVSSGLCRVTLLSPQASDAKFGQSLRIVDGLSKVVATGNEARRSQNLVVYDLNFPEILKISEAPTKFDVEVLEGELKWKVVGSVVLSND